MLHHVEIYVSSLASTRDFWADLLAQIGYGQTASFPGGFTLSREEGPYLTFVQVSERHGDEAYHRCRVGLNHLAFSVPGRERVDALRQYCIDRDLDMLYDEKYPFATGGDTYYALFVEDPDRIKVEFVAVDPA